MIHIDFNPQKLTGRHKAWWDAWQRRADAAALENIRIWEDWYQTPERKRSAAPAFNFKQGQRVWTQLKRFLLRYVFTDKCAYCETSAVRWVGDAEHYRPKGEVTSEARDVMMTIDEVRNRRGREIKHPGYFWLAYNWKNLLPACKYCNSGEGKQSKFPLGPKKRPVLLKHIRKKELTAYDNPLPSTAWKDFYYLQPEDLNKLEDPQLIHPYLEDPRREIKFGHAGLEEGVSERAKCTIRVFRLDDASLRRRRQNAQGAAWSIFTFALGTYQKTLPPKQAKKMAWQELKSYVEGKEEYSAAALDYVAEYYGAP